MSFPPPPSSPSLASGGVDTGIPSSSASSSAPWPAISGPSERECEPTPRVVTRPSSHPAPSFVSNQSEITTVLDGIASLRSKANALKNSILKIQAERSNAISALSPGQDFEQRLAVISLAYDEQLAPFYLKRAALLADLKDAGITDVFDVSVVAVPAASLETLSDGLPTLPMSKATGLARRVAEIFSIESVPVTDLVTKTVAWDRVPLIQIEEYPKLCIKVDPEWGAETQFKVVESVHTFFDHFEKHYRIHLADVFNHMAYRYMDVSLMECKQQTHYAKHIQRPEYEPRDWEAVKRCVGDLLHLGDLRADIAYSLMNIRRGIGEGMDLFIKRGLTMLRAVEGDSATMLIVRAFLNDLPQQGREQVLAHFGSLEKISSPEKLLDFYRTHKSVYDGERVDNMSWLNQKYGSDRQKFGTSQASSTSASRVYSTPGSVTQASRVKSAATYRAPARQSVAPYTPTQRVAAYRPTQQVGSRCKIPCCVWEGAKHSYDQCWSVTNPARHAQKEARYQASFGCTNGAGSQHPNANM